MAHGYGGSTTVIGEGAPSEPPATEARSGRWKSTSGMTVQFWGVRGSLACPEPEVARYGGNTSCVEVRCGDRLLIFDAGTGLRPLGNTLVESASPIEADIFLSHCHLDHISGLPFFAPCYRASSR